MGNFMPDVNQAAQAAQAVAAAQTRAIQLRDASIMNWAMRKHPGDWEGTFADFYKNGGSRMGGLAQEQARNTYRQTLANSGPQTEGSGTAQQEKAPFQRQWAAALAVGKKANWDPLVTQQGVNAAIMDTMVGHPRVAARIRNAWAQTPQDPQARVKYLESQYASGGDSSQESGDRSQETAAAQTEPQSSETDAPPSGSSSEPQTEPRPSGSGSEEEEEEQ